MKAVCENCGERMATVNCEVCGSRICEECNLEYGCRACNGGERKIE